MPDAGENPCWERLLRKQLLLLATLLVGVTYGAGINPPGGVWQDNGSGHKAGDAILPATYRHRYLVFYYCNMTALAASIVVMFLLLFKKPRSGVQLVMLRVVMVLDLLCLIGAYSAGSTRKNSSSVYIFAGFSFFSGGHLISIVARKAVQAGPQGTNLEDLDGRAALKPRELRKVVMLLATFMVVIMYGVGLSSPDGSWFLGEDVLMGLVDYKTKVRSQVFFYFNATAFLASLLVIVLALSTLWQPHIIRRLAYGLILGMLPSLLGAYAAGTCHNTQVTVYYVLCLIAALLAYIILVIVVFSPAWLCRQSSPNATTTTTGGGGGGEQEETVGNMVVHLGSNAIRRGEEYMKVRSLILLLATLTATITYQAGLHPPGGVWTYNGDGHLAGYPIILSTQTSRYKVFFYCNSGAFVLSIAAIVMLTVKKDKIHTTTLLVSMILDMVALMGAYAAGILDMVALIYVAVAAMACGVIVCVMIHLLCVTVQHSRMEMEDTRLLKKRHKRLLLVEILVATITYKAGLNPPGGFQQRLQDDGHAAGAAVLVENYPRRFWAFFYCNTVSFMATLALVLFFTCPNVYQRAGRWYYALYGCIVLALLCLMVAFEAGIVKPVHASPYVFVLLAMVVSVVAFHSIQSRAFLLKKEEDALEEFGEDGSSAIFGHAHVQRPRPRPRQIPRARLRLRSAQETMYRQVYTSHKHLILLGILAAGTTYQAGLNPPGGLWGDNGSHGDAAGNPVMYDNNRIRYLTFVYSNSASFVASVFIVGQQLLQIMHRHQPKDPKLLALATNTALVLDLFCILAAYGAGTARQMTDISGLVVLVLFCVGIHSAPFICTLYGCLLVNY